MYGDFFIISLLSFNACEQSGGFGLGEENITPVEFVLEEVEVTSSVVLLDSVVSSDVGRGLLVRLLMQALENQFYSLHRPFG